MTPAFYLKIFYCTKLHFLVNFMFFTFLCEWTVLLCTPHLKISYAHFFQHPDTKATEITFKAFTFLKICRRIFYFILNISNEFFANSWNFERFGAEKNFIHDFTIDFLDYWNKELLPLIQYSANNSQHDP